MRRLLPLLLHAACTGRVAQLKARAAFDLDCPKRELEVYTLGSRSQRGVSGCGREATYVLSPSGVWVMDSASRSSGDRPRMAAKARGGLDPEAIDRVLEDEERSIMRCHKRNRSAEGELVVSVVVAPDGRVDEASVVESATTLTDRDVEDCALDRIMKWRFPRSGGESVVRAPFRFERRDRDERPPRRRSREHRHEREPEVECKTGADGGQACGYHCTMGADGKVACADTPEGKCAMGATGRVTCSKLRGGVESLGD